MKSSTKGFSVVELMMVAVIIVILSVIAIPSIQRINLAYKMDASGHTIAGFLTQARLQAVHNNAPAYAHFDIANPSLAFINNDNTGTFAAGNPDVAVSGGVQLVQNTGTLDHQQLDAYLGVVAGPGGPIVKIGGPIGFNARGLPCLQQGASTAVCVQQDGPGGPVPVFEWFMTDGNGNWEAVTVTAAGRIKAWRYAGQGNWQ